MTIRVQRDESEEFRREVTLLLSFNPPVRSMPAPLGPRNENICFAKTLTLQLASW